MAVMSKPGRIKVTGKMGGPKHSRRLVVIGYDEQKVWLTEASYFILFKLAHHAKVMRWAYGQKESWLHKSELGDERFENVARYIYRLKQEVNLQLTFLSRWKVVENDRNCHYRLLVDTDTVIDIDYEEVLGFPNYEVEKICREALEDGKKAT